MRKKIAALLTGLIIPVIAFCGLETGTYISDLVVTNPLSSDLASTSDDHLRLLKTTIKNTFPNINGAVSSTDEELSLLSGRTGTVWTSTNDGAASTLDADLLDGVSSAGFCQTGGTGCPGGVTGAANPSASLGLSAINGSATTFMRSDGAPALSQSIVPTWTGAHTFTNGFTVGNKGGITISAGVPLLELDESDAAANNQKWWMAAVSETLQFQAANDARTSGTAWMTVDRTANTVDSVAISATAFTVNSVALTPVSSSFTGTAEDMSGSVTMTVKYFRVGDSVVLFVPTFSGTSDGTNFTVTGMPAAIRPTTTTTLPIAYATNNTAEIADVTVQISSVDGSLIFRRAAGAAWTGSGTKGVPVAITLVYLVSA